MTFPVYLLLLLEPTGGLCSIHQLSGDAAVDSSSQQQQLGDDSKQVSLQLLQITSSGPVVTTASASLPALFSRGDSSTESFTAWLNAVIPTQTASLLSISTEPTSAPPQCSQSAAAGVLTTVTTAPLPAMVLSAVAAVPSASVTSTHMMVTQGPVQSSASAVVSSLLSSVTVTAGTAVVPVVTPIVVTATTSTVVVTPFTVMGIQILAAGL